MRPTCACCGHRIPADEKLYDEKTGEEYWDEFCDECCRTGAIFYTDLPKDWSGPV
jgi:hypothetical protein